MHKYSNLIHEHVKINEQIITNNHIDTQSFYLVDKLLGNMAVTENSLNLQTANSINKLSSKLFSTDNPVSNR